MARLITACRSMSRHRTDSRGTAWLYHGVDSTAYHSTGGGEGGSDALAELRPHKVQPRLCSAHPNARHACA